MSGNERRGPDSVEREADAPGYHVGDFDALVKRLAAVFGLNPQKAQYVCQVPGPEIENDFLWEIWEVDGKVETCLQIRTARCRRILSEETTQRPSDGKEPDSRDGEVG